MDAGDVPVEVAQPLVDGHCHSVVAATPDRPAFELFLTEADQPPPPGVSYADSPLGLAVRRWCAPPLELPPGVGLDDYLARRADLGPHEVGVRLLGASGLSHLLVDTGIGGDGYVRVGSLGAAADAEAREVVRLETVAESVAASGVRPDDFAEVFVATLSAATSDAVAVKSILAYRHGFDVDPARPTPADVRTAARAWLGGSPARDGRQWRLDDPVLLRFVLWCGIDRGLPVQLHTGFGDRDVRLASVNPALLQGFFASVEPTGVPIVLLHCYPYHREAGWLASVYRHVYVDVGLTLSHVGAQANVVLGEFCELAPFGKLLYSSDAYGLPELYLVGAAQFRMAMGAVLTRWRQGGAVTAQDAQRIATSIGSANARRLYAL
jgi:predicted TIM-barrel fold metal-dependent hydrolase